MTVRRRSLLAGLAVTGAVLGRVVPGVTWLPPVRRYLSPALSGLGSRGHLALTFDDGPDLAGTPAVLAVLERLGWHATFFMLGSSVRAQPQLAAQVAHAGHEVAVHGNTHRYLLTRTPRGAYDDIARGLEAVAAATGAAPRWFRPPYGVLTTGGLLALRRLELQPARWSAWGRDWRAAATPQSVVAELGRGVLDGGTALLHDSDVTSAPAPGARPWPPFHCWPGRCPAAGSPSARWPSTACRAGPAGAPWPPAAPRARSRLSATRRIGQARGVPPC